MADISDIEAALVDLVATALYPQGTNNPSIAGVDCRVYRGWPLASGLNADLGAGRINVSIFPETAPGRVTTRHVPLWRDVAGSPSMTVRAVGTSVTWGGEAIEGQLTGVLVDGRPFVYRTASDDTPISVAANLATLLRSVWIVNQAGATLSIPGAGSVLARVAVDAIATREVRRQERDFRIAFWCPSPLTRDATAVAVDQMLAGVTFLDLSDQTQGRLAYVGTSVFDQSQSAMLYRRDLIYSVEYATTIKSSQPAMLFGDVVLNAAEFIA